MFKQLALAALVLVSAGSTMAADTQPAAAKPLGVKNIVIVPGAFTDGSGWHAVHDILVQKGYSVHVIQPRVDTLAADADIVYRQLRKEAGPVLLVGSDYGGAVITQAGDRRKVRGLVYVAAVAPNVGESVYQLINSTPTPAIADLKPTQDGYFYMDEAKYGANLAGDLSENRARFMAASQVPATLGAFRVATAIAAWQSKPSWGVVATEDRFYSPKLQRSLYERAGARVTEIKGSHFVYQSQPAAIAKLIETAAQSLQ